MGVLEKLDIKNKSLRNRFVLPPMQTKKADKKGAVTEDLKEHYRERAKGNGTVIVEHSFIASEGKYSENQLGIHEDDLIPGLSKLADTIKEEGSLAIIQINHAGDNIGDENIKSNPVAPSKTDIARELEIDEIKEIVRKFGGTTARAIEAGFDGVEVHGAHGFLLNQFYSPLSNEREDKYGGGFENRIKFPIEVVEEVKENIGDSLLFYRIGSEDLEAKGVQIFESVDLAEKLEERGVDVIDVSGGMCGSSPEDLQGVEGYFIPQASTIKESVEIPVIGVGGIDDPKFADWLVSEDKVDLVAVGRPQLSNPHWTLEAIEQLSD